MKTVFKIGIGITFGIVLAFCFPLLSIRLLQFSFTKQNAFEIHIEKIRGGLFSPLSLEGVRIKATHSALALEWDQLTSVECLLQEVLNRKLSFTGKAQLEIFNETLPLNTFVQLGNPSISIVIDGENDRGKVFLDANLDQGILRLNRPFFFSYGTINIYAEEENLSLPLYDLCQAHIPHIQIQLGKGDPFFAEHQNFRSTPLDLSVVDGVLQWERTDFLWNDSAFATWGKFSLINQTLEAVLGLASSTRDHLFQIPIEGPINELSVNLEEAILTAGRIIASKHGVADKRLLKAKTRTMLGNTGLENYRRSEKEAPPPRYDIPRNSQ